MAQVVEVVKLYLLYFKIHFNWWGVLVFATLIYLLFK